MPTQRTRRPAPTTRYRRGARTTATRRAHTEQSREWRRALARAELNDVVVRRLLRMLGRCGDVVRAADHAGVTSHLVYGRMRWDAGFAARVEEILARFCAESPWWQWCGRPQGYKAGGRCRDCRRAKRGGTGRGGRDLRRGRRR